MAVRKRTGFKGVSSPKLTALKAQRNAANKRLATANAQIKAAKAKSKAAKARSKSAIVRSKVAKKKIQKIKSKHRSKSIQTQRGVVKARGGGPASRPLSKVLSNSFMNPFPEAAAFQNPFTLGWRVVKGAKINPKTEAIRRSPYPWSMKVSLTIWANSTRSSKSLSSNEIQLSRILYFVLVDNELIFNMSRISLSSCSKNKESTGLKATPAWYEKERASLSSTAEAAPTIEKNCSLCGFLSLLRLNRKL